MRFAMRYIKTLKIKKNSKNCLNFYVESDHDEDRILYDFLFH